MISVMISKSKTQGAKEKYRFGIIGASAIARIHALALQNIHKVELIAVCDIDKKKAASLAAEFNIPIVLNDTKELFKIDDLDVVTIATPHYFHASMTIQAAISHKHVIVEKPLCISEDEADTMMKVCLENGVSLGVIFNNRYTKAAKSVREAVTQGILGRIFLGQVTVKWDRTMSYYETSAWRGKKEQAGGGVLTIQAIHAIDLLQWFLGPVESIVAYADCYTHNIEVEDNAICILRFKNGGIGSILGSVSAYPENPAICELYGENGSATLIEHRGLLKSSLKLRNHKDKGFPIYELIDELIKIPSQNSNIPSLVNYKAHRELFEDYLHCLKNGLKFSLDGEEGKKTVSLLAAIYRSIAERKEIYLC
jgi:UDP-N-acetyl-2-amino-2-deoxyglucuronate dehydrogenase